MDFLTSSFSPSAYGTVIAECLHLTEKLFLLRTYISSYATFHFNP